MIGSRREGILIETSESVSEKTTDFENISMEINIQTIFRRALIKNAKRSKYP